MTAAASTDCPIATRTVAIRPTALITPANSTAQVFASSNYYGIDWIRTYGQPQVVPFFLGPQGIANAVDRNGGDPAGVAVLSSGWGAGQTGTALGLMARRHDPALQNVRLMVLDNNTNRAGGGFWTTYPWVAPLLLTTAAPTPNDTTVPVVDTAYEYNINSDAPTYPLNVVADANSLMAYLYDYGGQASAPMPAEALQPVAPGAQHYHYVVAPDGTITDRYPVGGNITYVTFQSDRLPLLRPIRTLPGGNTVADAIEPAATALVDAGYRDNTPIPTDPGIPRPAAIAPPAPSAPTGVTPVAASASEMKAPALRKQKPPAPASSTLAAALRALSVPTTPQAVSERRSSPQQPAPAPSPPAASR